MIVHLTVFFTQFSWGYFRKEMKFEPIQGLLSDCSMLLEVGARSHVVGVKPIAGCCYPSFTTLSSRSLLTTPTSSTSFIRVENLHYSTSERGALEIRNRGKRPPRPNQSTVIPRTACYVRSQIQYQPACASRRGPSTGAWSIPLLDAYEI